MPKKEKLFISYLGTVVLSEVAAFTIIKSSTPAAVIVYFKSGQSQRYDFSGMLADEKITTFTNEFNQALTNYYN